MATVEISLKIHEQFSQTLIQAQKTMEATTKAADELKKKLQTPVALRIDTQAASAQLEQIQRKIRNISNYPIMLLLKKGLEQSKFKIELLQSKPLMDGIRQLGKSAQALLSYVETMMKGKPHDHDWGNGSSGGPSVKWWERIVMSNNGANTVTKAATSEPAKVDTKAKTSFFTNLLGGAGFIAANIKDPGELFNGISGQVAALIDSGVDQQRLQDKFIVTVKDEAIGTQLFLHFKDAAEKAGTDISKALEGIPSLLPKVQNIEQADKLNSYAQRLSVFDVSGKGTKNAYTAMEKAMGGDTKVLVSDFKMSEQNIKESKIEDIAKTGNMDEFLGAFDQLLEKERMGKALADQMLNRPAQQVDELSNRLKNAFTNVGGHLLAYLLPVIEGLNQALESGEFDEFFNNLSTALAIVVSDALFLFNVFFAIFNFIVTYWPVIEPLIWGIVSAIAAWKAIQLIMIVVQTILIAKMLIEFIMLIGLRTAWSLLSSTMKANVIILIISLIIGLIVWLIKLWNTNDEFAAGLMRTWNNILNFFDQAKIFFTALGLAIALGFNLAFAGVFRLIENNLNRFIDMVNEKIKSINSLFGANFKLIDHVDFSGVINKFQSNADNLTTTGAATLANMVKEAEDKAAEREKKVQEMLDARKVKKDQLDDSDDMRDKINKQLAAGKQDIPVSPYPPSSSDIPTNLAPNVNRVESVGEIDDTVDVESDDIKVMRDLAEIQSIQNFVSLTPTVQVTTGDIHNPTDAEEIIRRIEEVMVREVTNSAQGVYG